MTRFWLFILACGLIFTSVVTAFSPRLLTWYATPPVDIGVTCDTAIQWGMEKLIAIQMFGLVAGAILGAIMYFWIRGKRNPPAVTPAKV